SDLHVLVALKQGSTMQLRESDLDVATSPGGIPVTPAGDPWLSKWTAGKGHPAGTTRYEFIVPLSSVGGTPGQDLDIAVYEFLLGPNGGKFTGWSNGLPIFSGKPAEYFVYTVQRCGSPPPPPPGKDIVVINDINVFDANAMQNPNNVLFVQNLV